MRIRSMQEKTSERNASRAERSLERLRAEKERLGKAIERIEAAVDALPSVERRLIIMRYNERLSWEKISQDLGYSSDYLRGKLHQKALASLREY